HKAGIRSAGSAADASARRAARGARHDVVPRSAATRGPQDSDEVITWPLHNLETVSTTTNGTSRVARAGPAWSSRTPGTARTAGAAAIASSNIPVWDSES